MWTREFYNGKVAYLELDYISPVMEAALDDSIRDICFNHPSYSKKEAKEHILDFLNSLNANDRIGAIAEFFTHLFLKYHNLKQESAFINLEEVHALKRGFDGVYTDGNDRRWFMESKSGEAYSTGVSHKAKVKNAYDDLENKFAGSVSNNPWENAVHHVMCTTGRSDLITEFRNLSLLYTSHTPLNVNDYNVIPAGTVFDSVAAGRTYNPLAVTNDVNDFLRTTHTGIGEAYAICVTNNAIAQFMAYLTR